MGLEMLMSGPLMIAVAAVLAIVLGVVVVSLVRGMLNMMLASLLIITVLLTAEMFFAFYLSTEGSMKDSLDVLIQDDDLAKIVDIIVVAIDEEHDEFKLDGPTKTALVEGITESDKDKVNIAVGAILFDKMEKELADKDLHKKLGVDKLELSGDQKQLLAKKMIEENDTEEIKKELVAQIQLAAIREAALTEPGAKQGMDEKVENLYGNALGDALVGTIQTAGKALGADTILPITDPQVIKFKELQASVKGSADFSKKYKEMNIGLSGSLSEPKAMFQERGPEAIFAIALPLISSPFAMVFPLVNDELSPAELNGKLKTGLIIFVVLDLILGGGLFLINGVLSLSISTGFKDAFKYFGIALMIAGVLLFGLMKMGTKVTSILDDDGPIMSRMEGETLESRIGLGVSRIYISNIRDQVKVSLEKRTMGGIGLVLIGACSYANSILGIFLTGKGKKKETKPEPQPEPEPAKEEE